MKDFSKENLQVLLARAVRDYGEDAVFEVASWIAENDSIGEGYGYCHSYGREDFDRERAMIEEGRYQRDVYLGLAVVLIGIIGRAKSS